MNKLIMTVSAGTLALSALSASKWMNPNGGSWDDPANWDNGVPNATDVTITNLTSGAAASVTSAVSTVKTVTIYKDNKLRIAPGGSLTVNGSVSDAAQSTVLWFNNGKLEMTGGSLSIPNSSFYCAGTVGGATISGDATVSAKILALRYGSMTFSGTSKLTVGSSSDCALYGAVAYEANAAKLTFSDSASLDASGASYVTMGNYYWPSQNNKCRLNIAGGTHLFPYTVRLGYANGESTVNMTGGSVTGGYYSFSIGSYDSSKLSTKTQNPKTTFNLSGGSLFVDCSHATYGTPQDRITGLVVGNGSQVGSYFSTANYSCTGILNISGATTRLDVGPAFVAVGIGRATGTVIQNGGAVTTGNSMTTDAWRRKEPMMIGQGGGTGTYVISNGTLTVSQELYVGGVKTNVFVRSKKITGYPSDAETAGKAVGLLDIEGGSVNMPYGVVNCVVGADGAGTLRIAGSGSFTTEGLLVLSNNVASTLQIALNPDGAPTVRARGVRIAPGAKLEVDVSKYAGDERWIRLLQSASTALALDRQGAFAPEDITIIGNNGDYDVVQSRPGDTTKSVWIHRKKGLSVFIR